MLTTVIILKNGKHFSINGNGDRIEKCPYDKTELDMTDEKLTGGFATEFPQDLLPEILKQAMIDSYEIFQCKKCGRYYLRCEEGDWDRLHFYEVELQNDFQIRPNEKHSEKD
jgi:hypothetical protein